MLTRDLLNELFWYDKEIGQLRRKVKTSNRNKINDVAGSLVHGYRRININRKIYMAHRLIWLMLIGEIPDGLQIDHCDGNRDNNQLTNLRLASSGQNVMNGKMRKDNTSGAKGVSFDKRSGSWRARIYNDGKEVRKMFATKELAESFVAIARDQLHGEFANHGVHKCELQKGLA